MEEVEVGGLSLVEGRVESEVGRETGLRQPQNLEGLSLMRHLSRDNTIDLLTDQGKKWAEAEEVKLLTTPDLIREVDVRISESDEEVVKREEEIIAETDDPEKETKKIEAVIVEDRLKASLELLIYKYHQITGGHVLRAEKITPKFWLGDRADLVGDLTGDSQINYIINREGAEDMHRILKEPLRLGLESFGFVFNNKTEDFFGTRQADKLGNFGFSTHLDLTFKNGDEDLKFKVDLNFFYGKDNEDEKNEDGGVDNEGLDKAA